MYSYTQQIKNGEIKFYNKINELCETIIFPRCGQQINKINREVSMNKKNLCSNKLNNKFVSFNARIERI